MRDLLPKYRNLKLILMSAALNIQLFSNYFSGCPILHGTYCYLSYLPVTLWQGSPYHLIDMVLLPRGFLGWETLIVIIPSHGRAYPFSIVRPGNFAGATLLPFAPEM